MPSLYSGKIISQFHLSLRGRLSEDGTSDDRDSDGGDTAGNPGGNKGNEDIDWVRYLSPVILDQLVKYRYRATW